MTEPLGRDCWSPVKGKVVLYLTNQALHHEGVWRSGCIDPRFLHLRTSRR
jgi:hypothetical protein